jgi:RNA-directed DNA polymerase
MRELPAVPVKERRIPKRGGKTRRLGIPTLRDEVVQAAIKLVLDPIFEADFQPCSYGFRPRRRAQDAIAEVHHLTSRSYEWIIEADIEACSDSLDHTALMGRVRARVADRRVLRLIKAFLKAGIMLEPGELEGTLTGTPQGGILSPLLANIASPHSTSTSRGRGRRWAAGRNATGGGSEARRPTDSCATPTTSSSASRASDATRRRSSPRSNGY